MALKEKLKEIYEHKYKWLMLIPFLILLLAFIQIGFQYATTGDFVHRGISLKGGSTITIDYAPSFSLGEIESFLREKFPQSDITLRTISSAGEITSLAIDSNMQEEEEIQSLMQAVEEKTGLSEEQLSVEVIGSSLGESFFRQVLTALLFAFLLMGSVVLLYFRTIIPSLAVILAAFSDITVTLAIFNLTGIRLNTAGIAAFLMLIGYSVDTDILLTSRVLKRKEGTIMERIYGAIRTGMTMGITTLAAILVGLIFVQSEVVKQIMIILFIGLMVDMVMTWIQNVGVLRLYLEKKKN